MMKTWTAAALVVLLGTACFAQDNSDSKTLALTKKLDSIIVPAVDFHEAGLSDAVNFLRQAAKENDSDKAGVNIVLMDRENKATVTIQLDKVSLHKILKLVAEMAGLSVDVEEDTVVLRRLKKDTE